MGGAFFMNRLKGSTFKSFNVITNTAYVFFGGTFVLSAVGTDYW